MAGKQTASSPPVPDDVAHLTYEQARDELVEVVRALETGGTTLEESVTLLERGERLAAICEARLTGVRSRLNQVTNDPTATAGHEATAPGEGVGDSGERL